MARRAIGLTTVLLCLGCTVAAADNVALEVWTNVVGTNIEDFLIGDDTKPLYPRAADMFWRTNLFELPSGVDKTAQFAGFPNPADNYVGRIFAYLVPPATGAYTFWLCTSDDGRLWLSCDEAAVNAVEICAIDGWLPSNNFDPAAGSGGHSRLQSSAITLTAGNRYYIEAAVKAGGGPDHIYVNWAGPSPIGPDRVPIAQQYLSKVLVPQELLAQNPDPADGARIGSGGSVLWLTWTAGAFAQRHHVYFGTNAADVANGIGGTDKGLTTDTMYLATGLVAGTTYYWRVDEVNDVHPDSPWAGDVWSFRVASAKAENPSPPDGARYVLKNSPLTWDAGHDAILSVVYMGTSLTNLDIKTLVPYTRYTPTGQTDGMTYYWRIDSSPDGVSIVTGDVWSYTTIPAIPIVDPNLMLWYTFDEGSGDTVVDWSGHGNHGVLTGGVWITEGMDGGAVALDGDDYVEAVSYKGIGGGRERACMAWVKTSGSYYQEIMSWGGDGWGMQQWVMALNGGALEVYVTGGWARTVETGLDNNEWHHVAAILVDDDLPDINDIEFYVNGVLSARASFGVNPIINTSLQRPFRVGGPQGLQGAIDDVRVYDTSRPTGPPGPCTSSDPRPRNRALLSPDQSERLWWSSVRREPCPWGAICIRPDLVPCEAMYDVYFGTSHEMVAAATVDNPLDVYMGRQDANEWPVGGGLTLAWGQQYYWRVDAIDTAGVLKQGRVWSFAVADYLVVDDFESYGDMVAPGGPTGRVEYVWKDGAGYTEPAPGYPGNGTGSRVDLSQAIVHSGWGALSMDFDNSAEPFYSAVEADANVLAVGSDWDREQVRAMSVWFKGEPDNSAEWMYVELVDGAGRLRRVFYPDVVATRYEAWTQWHIALGAFQGVNLADVESVSLGIGTPGGGNPAGAGRMRFDDIRLYRRRCVPEMVTGDATGDCRSDWADVAAVAGQWLGEGLGVAADMDGDGVVDFHDVAAMLENWLIGEVLWP